MIINTIPLMLAERLFEEVEGGYPLGAVGVAEDYGAKTLADLHYLQAAVRGDGYIDCWPGSKLLELISTLPSASLWADYVSIYDEAGNLAVECPQATKFVRRPGVLFDTMESPA